MTDLGTLGGQRTFPTAINSRGQVIGQSDTPRFPEAITDRGKFPRTFNHAFVWQNGKMTDLGTLPRYQASRAVAINNKGQIVGYTTKSGQRRVVLWTPRRGT